MKFSKIAQVCKKRNHLKVFTHNGVQWVSIYAAAYPLYGIPPLTEKNQLLALLDVPSDTWENCSVEFIEDPGDAFDDIDANDELLEDLPVTIEWRGGKTLVPFVAPKSRVYFAPEKYLKPIDITNEARYALRNTYDGGYAVAVFDGMSVCALIGVQLMPDGFTDTLSEIVKGNSLAWERGFSITRAQANLYGGAGMTVIREMEIE